MQLVQTDENLINNELTTIEKSEHLIKRESILEQLGLKGQKLVKISTQVEVMSIGAA
jgi:hypothetical protein